MAGFLDFLLPTKAEAPQSTIVPVGQQLGGAISTGTGLIPQLSSYNNALAQSQIGTQQAIDAQLYGPSAGLLQKSYYDKLNSALNGGLSPEMIGMINQNTAQTLSSSGLNPGIGAGDLYSKASLLRAGINQDQINLENARAGIGGLNSTRFNYTPQNFDLGSIANAQSANQAQIDNQANIARSVQLQNANQLKTLGYKIVGGVGGAVAGYFAGNPVGGAQAGMALGEGLSQGGGVYGYGQQQQQQQGGGGGSNWITSLLRGFGNSGGGGSFGAGAGGQYLDSGNNVMTSVKAQPFSFS